MDLDDQTLCERYEQLYTGAVTDSLDALGFTNRTLPSTIAPVTNDMIMAGIAYPVSGKPDEDADYEENIRRFLHMLGDAPANSIIAYQTSSEDIAHIGELSATALETRGCRGAVVDGGVRDTRYILDRDFPVFVRYRTPADAPPRWRLEKWDVPIRIGDVEIRPGDVIVGDIDGVVCVPRDVAEEVLEAAEETVNTENHVREAVRNGTSPIDAYEEYGKF